MELSEISFNAFALQWYRERNAVCPSSFNMDMMRKIASRIIAEGFNS